MFYFGVNFFRFQFSCFVTYPKGSIADFFLTGKCQETSSKNIVFLAQPQ